MKKLTWKDLLNELMAQSQQEDNWQDPMDLSSDSQKLMEDLRQEFAKIRSPDGEQNEMVFTLVEPTPEEINKLMEEYLDPDDRLLQLLKMSKGLTPEQANSEIHRIQDLMEQDGLLSPRDMVQKIMDRRAQETPLNVIQGPKTLQ